MIDAPPDDVLRAFGSAGPVESLRGGEGAWRAGDLVFKPAPGDAEWAWLGEHLPTVRGDGFRLAMPVPTPDERWVVDGWCAQMVMTGAHPATPRWPEVLEVCGRLHAALRALPIPPFLGERTHPWSIGDRVAWQEAAPRVEHPALDRLLAIRTPIDLPSQAIHGDLTENVLFAEGVPPAVIDPTIYWRPAGTALAIVVSDALQWSGAEPAPFLAAVRHVDEFPQLFVRAVITRLVTSLEFGRRDVSSFDRVVTVAESLAG